MPKTNGSLLAQFRKLLAEVTTRDEMTEVWQLIKDRDRQIMAEAARTVARTMGVGARVQFTGKGGEVVRGEVIQINRKTITVQSDDHRQWRVSASLLSADDQPAPAHIQPLTTYADPAESLRMLVGDAKAAMAKYPQYATHFNGYMLCRIRKTIKTKMGVAFRAGEIAIFNPGKPEHGFGGLTYPVWSRTNQIDTCLPATDFEPIGQPETEVACG
jgi:hypothetical protein